MNEIQPVLANLSINGKLVTVEEAAQLLGERLFGHSMNGATNANELICACNKSLPGLHTEILKLAKTMFPGHKFLDFEIPT